MYARVVVPVDGSLVSERAVPHGEALARAFGIPLLLLRVMDTTPVGLYDEFASMSAEYLPGGALEAKVEADARAYLEDMQSTLSARGIDAHHELRSGAIVRELLAAARDGDVYVMASHGRTGMPRWFMGSVAEEMTRQSRVPVMLVRSEGITRD